MNATRAAVAGVIATAVVTALWWVEPVLGIPRLAVGSMLSSFLAVATAYLPIWPVVGWTIHLLVGILLAFFYARALADRLSGPIAVRGFLFGCLVFIVAQIAFMPLVGAGLFSRGDVPLLIGSFIGHVVYGVLVATIYGAGRTPTPAAR
jgi:hypothetical protein